MTEEIAKVEQPAALSKREEHYLNILLEIEEMKLTGEIDDAEAAVLAANTLALWPNSVNRVALLREAQARLAKKFPDGRVAIDLRELPSTDLHVGLAELPRTYTTELPTAAGDFHWRKQGQESTRAVVQVRMMTHHVATQGKPIAKEALMVDDPRQPNVIGCWIPVEDLGGEWARIADPTSPPALPPPSRDVPA